MTDYNLSVVTDTLSSTPRQRKFEGASFRLNKKVDDIISTCTKKLTVITWSVIAIQKLFDVGMINIHYRRIPMIQMHYIFVVYHVQRNRSCWRPFKTSIIYFKLSQSIFVVYMREVSSDHKLFISSIFLTFWDILQE